jgi:hypothetical protein
VRPLPSFFALLPSNFFPSSICCVLYPFCGCPASCPLIPPFCTVKGADNMWSQNSMRTCTVAILVTPNWNSASVETGGTNQYRAHCIHLSLAVPIRRKFRCWYRYSWCWRYQTLFNWCRRNKWKAIFSSVCISWSWRSYFTCGSWSGCIGSVFSRLSQLRLRKTAISLW